MENIMYLDDYINLYIQKENKIYIIKPYKDTLENGKIINREKFIKKMTKVFNEKKINKFFNAEISIIINSLINSEDKKVIEYCLNEINYKKVNFIREEKFLKLDKNSLYINCNQTYINFYYIDYKGNTLIKNYQNDDLNKNIFSKIVQKINKKDIYLYGKNYIEMVDTLEKEAVNYYYFEDSNNLIINLALQ